MENKVVDVHVGKLSFYPLQARVCLLVYLRVDALHLPVNICIKGVAFRASHMSTPVESVYCEASALEKMRLSI